MRGVIEVSRGRLSRICSTALFLRNTGGVDPQVWEDKYRDREQLFSGRPNPALMTEAADLRPGNALEVGCGEGADALWLSRQGWNVTAVDVSGTALQRASALDTREAVRWIRADLRDGCAAWGRFDLVSVQYFPLLRQPGDDILRGLLDAVTANGTFLFVSHDPADLRHRRDFDIDDYYSPGHIAEFLDDAWQVLVNETRPRDSVSTGDTRHTHDTILRAQRRR